MFEIPCSCSDCMQSLANNNPRNALIHKAAFKVGQVVRYSNQGIKFLSDDEKEQKKLKMKLMVITKIYEDDGLLLYKVDSDSASLVEEELETVG